MNLNMSGASRWGFNLVILLALILGLYIGRAFIIPMVLALLFTAMLWPIVGWMYQPGIPAVGLVFRKTFPWIWPWMGRVRFPWSLASLIVVIGGVIVVLLVAVGFGVVVSKFVLDAGNEGQMRSVYAQFRAKLIDISPWDIKPDSPYFPADPGEPGVYQKIKSIVNDESFARNFFLESGSFLWQCVLVTFVLLFMLIEGPMLNRHLTEIFGPSPPVRYKVAAALRDMGNQIRAYLVWRTVINVFMASFLGLLYYSLRLSQSWTWALLTGVLLYIPYLGPILAGVGPVIDAFINCPSAWIAIGLLAFYTAFIVVEGYLIVPVVMGRGMELNATTVMLACLFWEQVWHTSGLFLAMPLMAVVRTVCVHVPGWSPWANLMGTSESVATTEGSQDIKDPQDFDFLDDTLMTQVAQEEERFHEGTEVKSRREES